MRVGPIRCWYEWTFDALFVFLFLNLYMCFINDQITKLWACNKQLSSVILHRCCHLVVYNRSCSVPPTVSAHFYELGDAGMLFANNQRCRNAVPLCHKTIQPLLPKTRASSLSMKYSATFKIYIATNWIVQSLSTSNVKHCCKCRTKPTVTQWNCEKVALPNSIRYLVKSYPLTRSRCT